MTTHFPMTPLCLEVIEFLQETLECDPTPTQGLALKMARETGIPVGYVFCRKEDDHDDRLAFGAVVRVKNVILRSVSYASKNEDTAAAFSTVMESLADSLASQMIKDGYSFFTLSEKDDYWLCEFQGAAERVEQIKDWMTEKGFRVSRSKFKYNVVLDGPTAMLAKLTFGGDA